MTRRPSSIPILSWAFALLAATALLHLLPLAPAASRLRADTGEAAICNRATAQDAWQDLGGRKFDHRTPPRDRTESSAESAEPEAQPACESPARASRPDDTATASAAAGARLPAARAPPGARALSSPLDAPPGPPFGASGAPSAPRPPPSRA